MFLEEDRLANPQCPGAPGYILLKGNALPFPTHLAHFHNMCAADGLQEMPPSCGRCTVRAAWRSECLNNHWLYKGLS